ncbi:hypothetical protein N7448_001372 [Penicillium atrosanguineum]|uniref:Glycerol 2-dehydrogenase (NADP(+)) n=1 Tax=Penicillium atrosanguineum TaxID=1132637 RepID=UPI0023A44C32|nr:Glycerol 2-dehydrogenase (NADP(+)) [Penicillium atrosanguineum]KAJ5149794.1 hypothetical protein N7448_001372 [Penicillium atrosanguineum]KAJ5305109.1 Glycerol 2-dehydrogenase (NADP(+)) [Penicillium atrosanguineum]
MDNEKKAQKDSDRLARVRENQHKSRARKQAYVSELEQRVAAIQQETRQMDITNRIVLQEIETENRLIKNLIVSLGFWSELIKRYLQLADQNTVVDRKVAIPAAIGRSVETRSVASCQSPCSTPSPQLTTGVFAVENHSVEQPMLYDYVRGTGTVPTLQSIEGQQNCTMAISTAMGRPVEARSVASCQSPCSTPSPQVTTGNSAGGNDFVKQRVLHDYTYSTNTISTQQPIEEQQMSPISPSRKEDTIGSMLRSLNPSIKMRSIRLYVLPLRIFLTNIMRKEYIWMVFGEEYAQELRRLTLIAAEYRMTSNFRFWTISAT